jgi:nicotinamide-nucleotide amidase
MSTRPAERQLLTAEVLSIGTELTVGETRDTNGGELAQALSLEGVTVGRITALPDRLDVVTAAFQDAIDGADLVVSTGGLGPTPDDLTRESIAAAVGETPLVDPGLETWLRGRWERRGLPFPEINLKQAWVIPSCEPLPNPNGSAPGWLVSRSDGRVIAAMPGPPREMRPMWANELLPRLKARGLGRDLAVRTFRLTGIGESQVAELLGEDILRRTDPEIATYARLEAVDVRISAMGAREGSSRDGSAQDRVEAAAAVVVERLGEYVWAEGDTTWSGAIGARLRELGWRLAVEEIGTGGQLAALFGDVDWLAVVEGRPLAAGSEDGNDDLLERARRARSDGGVEVGLAVRARPRGSELAVSVGIMTPNGERRQTRSTYTGGSLGRSQAALLAAAALSAALRET